MTVPSSGLDPDGTWTDKQMDGQTEGRRECNA